MRPEDELLPVLILSSQGFHTHLKLELDLHVDYNLIPTASLTICLPSSEKNWKDLSSKFILPLRVRR